MNEVILAPDEALLPRKSVPVGAKWPELFGPGKLKLNDPLGGTYAALAGNPIASPTSIAPNPAATICPALLIFLPAGALVPSLYERTSPPSLETLVLTLLMGQILRSSPPI